MNSFVLSFENLDELLITTRNLSHRRIAGDLLAAPVDQWIPEAGPADGKADEARHACRGREPFADFAVIFAASQDDAADLNAPTAAGRSHYFFAVFRAVKSFDLPHVRLDPSVLQLLNALRHQPGTQCEVVGLLVSSN